MVSARAHEPGRFSRSRWTMEQDIPWWNRIRPLEDFGVNKGGVITPMSGNV